MRSKLFVIIFGKSRGIDPKICAMYTFALLDGMFRNRIYLKRENENQGKTGAFLYLFFSPALTALLARIST
jgi:hypothetical protein